MVADFYEEKSQAILSKDYFEEQEEKEFDKYHQTIESQENPPVDTEKGGYQFDSKMDQEKCRIRNSLEESFTQFGKDLNSSKLTPSAESTMSTQIMEMNESLGKRNSLEDLVIFNSKKTEAREIEKLKTRKEYIQRKVVEYKIKLSIAYRRSLVRTFEIKEFSARLAKSQDEIVSSGISIL